MESKFYGTTKITVSEGDFWLGFAPRVRMNAQSFLRGSLIATVLASGSATPLSAEPLEITAGFAAVNDPSFGQREDLGFGEAYQTWLELSGGQGPTGAMCHLGEAPGPSHSGPRNGIGLFPLIPH